MAKLKETRAIFQGNKDVVEVPVTTNLYESMRKRAVEHINRSGIMEDRKILVKAGTGKWVNTNNINPKLLIVKHGTEVESKTGKADENDYLRT